MIRLLLRFLHFSLLHWKVSLSVLIISLFSFFVLWAISPVYWIYAELGILVSIVFGAYLGYRLWSYKRWVALLTGVAGVIAGSQLFSLDPIGFVIISLVIWWFLQRSGDFQGWFGEQKVAEKLAQLTKEHPNEYFVFNNILLQNEHHSSEIDHVVISRYGIFSIETKAYARAHITEDGRWFSGQDTDRARDLGDPLKQNRGHIKALRAVLGDAKYLSCVVLTRASLSGNVPSGVVTLESLNEVIRSHREIVLDESRVRSLVGELERVNKTDKNARREHIRRVQEKKRLAQAGDFIDE